LKRRRTEEVAAKHTSVTEKGPQEADLHLASWVASSLHVITDEAKEEASLAA
jgi:hypothetical protein